MSLLSSYPVIFLQNQVLMIKKILSFITKVKIAPKVNRLAENINEIAEKTHAIEDIVERIIDISERQPDLGRVQYVKSELAGLLKDFRIGGIKPSAVVVLGDVSPSELFLISQVASNDALIVNVREGQLSAHNLAFYEALIDRILYGKQEFAIIERGMCMNDNCKKVGKILKKYGKRHIDLLWFSSLGSYRDFIKCLKCYVGLLRKNSRIVLSGIRADKPKEGKEGARVWHTVKKLFKYQEYLERNPSEVRKYVGSALGGGLGVIVWDPRDNVLKTLGIELDTKSKKKTSKGSGKTAKNQKNSKSKTRKSRPSGSSSKNKRK